MYLQPTQCYLPGDKTRAAVGRGGWPSKRVSNYDIDGDDNGNGKDNDVDDDGDKVVRACY
jgi:hypothetical protein